MPFQGVCRIIGGTQQGHMGLPDEIPGTHGRVGKLAVTQFPDFLSGLFTQMSGVAEVPLQLQVGPVV